MSNSVQPVQGYKLNSTNGIGNVVVLVILAIAAAFGIGEDVVQAFVAAAVPLGLLVREILEGLRKPRWSGNIATYLSSAVILLAPWLADLLNVVSPIAEALAEGNFNAVWPLLIPVVNSLLLLFKTKPWQVDPATA